MRYKTKNSEYIVDGSNLWQNGALYTEDIRYVGGMASDMTTIYDGVPNIGDMLYIEHGENRKYIRTSTVKEVSQ